jgi:hypothetical protein
MARERDREEIRHSKILQKALEKEEIRLAKEQERLRNLPLIQEARRQRSEVVSVDWTKMRQFLVIKTAMNFF